MQRFAVRPMKGLRSWGLGVQLLSLHSEKGIRNIACNILDKFALRYDPDELTEEVLINPHAFLRTVILIARQRDLKTPGRSGLPLDLH
ncbi:MAG: hypothetical protein HGA74_17315 [Deltaproteobacteria bacterium]|jgi:hypothetical protein|nr:hypothetical protein [Deltaproteobacteria bacterium]